MTKIFVAIFLAMLQPGLAAAQPSLPKPEKFAKPAPPIRTKTCAEYGPGFVKLEGTEVCVKIGGAVSVQSGVNGGR